MPNDQMPDMAKLEREGVSLRKCIAYGESGYSGSKSAKPATMNSAPKPGPMPSKPSGY